MKKQKTKTEVLYLECGTTLETMVQFLKNHGNPEFKDVTIDMNSVSCCRCGPEDYYCYCESAYNDIRLEWEVTEA
jgi:hypothetical protein